MHAVIKKTKNLKHDNDNKFNYFQKCFENYLKEIFTKTLKYFKNISVYL